MLCAVIAIQGDSQPSMHYVYHSHAFMYHYTVLLCLIMWILCYLKHDNAIIMIY